jgi:hypothetical protein
VTDAFIWLLMVHQRTKRGGIKKIFSPVMKLQIFCLEPAEGIVQLTDHGISLTLYAPGMKSG